MIKVSVVVPIYNQENYLNECIDSLLKQKYDNIEIILVDDGSSDNSGRICDEYVRNNRSRCSVVHKKNEGLPLARKTGWEKASGEYVCFVDSDDWVDDLYVKSLVVPVLKKPDIDIVICESLEDYCRTNKDEYGISMRNEAINRVFDYHTNGWSTCGKLYKRRKLLDIKEWWTTNGMGEDTELNWRIFGFSQKFYFIRGSHYYARLNPNSMTRREYKGKYVGYIERYERILDCLDKKSNSIRTTMVEHVFFKTYDYFMKMLGTSSEEYKTIKKAHDLLIETVDEVKVTEKNRYACEMGRAKFEDIEEVIVRQEKLLYDKLSAFSNVCDKLFIYGNGMYGKKIKRIMERRDIHYNGFVVTNRIDYKKKDVYLLDEIIRMKKDNSISVGLVIAMSDNNAQTIPSETIDYNGFDVMSISNEIELIGYLEK